MQFDQRVDAYIDKSAPFAREILRYFRELVHSLSPDITETVKWGFPHFEYKGTLCSMAGFKQHCAIGIAKASLLTKGKEGLEMEERTAMGHFGRITTVSDLPKEKVLKAMLKEVMTLNEKGIKVEKKVTLAKDRKELVVPEVLEAALKKNKKAAEVFYNFSYSHKKEYIEWITDAKTDSTRDKRLAQTIEWLNEGKERNWKYKNC